MTSKPGEEKDYTSSTLNNIVFNINFYFGHSYTYVWYWYCRCVDFDKQLIAVLTGK